jgi:hypothetical protein
MSALTGLLWIRAPVLVPAVVAVNDNRTIAGARSSCPDRVTLHEAQFEHSLTSFRELASTATDIEAEEPTGLR